MKKTALKSKVVSLATTLALATAMAPAAAFAATDVATASIYDPSYTITTKSTGDLDQHVVLTVDYGVPVSVSGDYPSAGVEEGDLVITIAGYDITADNYFRPVEATADGNNLVLDIGNVINVIGDDEQPTFTAQYGGVIKVSGKPSGVTAGGQAVGALDIYTVIPTGVEITMESGAGTNDVTAAVTHKANVRSMVHAIVYEEIDGELHPVNKNGATSGNLGVGAVTTHAHMFTIMTEAQLAAGVVSALSAAMPDGYSVELVSGAQFKVTGPEGSKLYVYIFDDAMLQELGQTFSGVISNEGVMTDYLPQG